jgi:hypothetical protein
MDIQATLAALGQLKAKQESWTEEEAKELTEVEKWLCFMERCLEEEHYPLKEAGIITVEINNNRRTIYHNELRNTLKAYIETGHYPEPANWETEAKIEADKISKAVREELKSREEKE